MKATGETFSSIKIEREPKGKDAKSSKLSGKRTVAG